MPLLKLLVHPWTLSHLFRNCCMALLIELKQVWVSTYLLRIGEFTLLSPMNEVLPSFDDTSSFLHFPSTCVCVFVSAFLRSRTHTHSLSLFLSDFLSPLPSALSLQVIPICTMTLYCANYRKIIIVWFTDIYF